MREDQQLIQMNRIRKRMLEETRLHGAEIKYRFSHFSPSDRVSLIEAMWDKMFMIDLYPGNRERFGINWDEIVDMILRKQT